MIATASVPSGEVTGMTKLETLGHNVFGPAVENEDGNLASNSISSARDVVSIGASGPTPDSTNSQNFVS